MQPSWNGIGDYSMPTTEKITAELPCLYKVTCRCFYPPYSPAYLEENDDRIDSTRWIIGFMPIGIRYRVLINTSLVWLKLHRMP